MDTPRHLTWDELVKLASGNSGRIRWRQRVRDIANGNKGRVEVIIHGELPRKSRRIQQQQRTTKTTNTNTTATATASKPQPTQYQRRDAHEAFFRPAQHPTTKSKTTKRSKPKALTRTHLTDKQRQQWAREHYELNYQFPAILGHHQPQQQSTSLSLSPLPQHEQTLLQPPTAHSLLQHLGNETDHHQLLQQLDMMTD